MRTVRLIGVEAGGRGDRRRDATPRALPAGRPGVLQGTRTFVLQDEAGNIELTHSVSAGLDYAAVGPEHAWLHERGRAEYHYVSDDEALEAFQTLARTEGILPALESSHAIAYVMKVATRARPRRRPAREPLGPRRQGRPDRRAAAEGGRHMSRIDAAFRELRGAGTHRPGDLRHGRRPRSRAQPRDPRAARSRRRRRSRGRRAVLGSRSPTGR